MHVNYSAPHSQNRLSEASFLLMWLLRRINSAAQSYECKHSTPVRDVYAGSRVNYSAPHSQNRLFEAFLLLMWLLRHIESGIFLRMRAFDVYVRFA